MSNKLTVVCVLRTPPAPVVPTTKAKQYGPSDVLRLQKGVATFLSIPHNFACLTDQPDIPGVRTIPLIGDTPGWWGKAELFRPGLFPGPVLYIDLDTAICNEIDSLVHSCTGRPFVATKEPGYGRLASGILYWEGDQSYLWDAYCADPKGIQYKYKRKPFIGDQAFLADNLKEYTFFTDDPAVPESWFCRMKANTTPLPDTRFLVAAGVTNKLYDARYDNHPWVKKFWKDII
jgi:hypothetical protein